MEERPNLIKPHKTRKVRLPRKTQFGGFFIGIKNEGDANTNEILYRALEYASLSTEHERKEYRGKPVNVWNVPTSFIEMLYKKHHDFKLLFVVYEEINYTLQLFELLDPIVQKKAKIGRMKIVKKLKNIKNKEGKTMAENKMNENKLETLTFADEKTAITALMKEKGYYSLRYNLSAKQKTPERIHWSDVWIILPGGIAGRCIISVAGYLDETFELFQDRAIAILVPAESRYYLKGLSPNMFYSILSQE